MILPFKRKRKFHLFLFIVSLCLQVWLLFLWSRHAGDESETAARIEESKKINPAFVYSNGATVHYFDAQNYFMEYLHSYKSEQLKNYRKSLDTMMVYLDSLNELGLKSHDFGYTVSKKKKTEADIIALRKQLDSLLKIDIQPLSLQDTTANFDIAGYNFNKTLRSIRYDSIMMSDEVLQKGMFRRIGDAISGKYDIRREELKIYITMVYGNKPKKGSIEDQMANIFRHTDQHYRGEFSRLKTTYTRLREKDRTLMSINREILKNSQQILTLYTTRAQEASKQRYQDALTDLKTQYRYIGMLLPAMCLLTLLLLAYSVHAYFYEKDLSRSKAEAEKNLEFKSRILGMLSHEMRAPLKILSAQSAEMLQGKHDKKLLKQIGLMHFTSNSLQITANQILEFFKKEQSKLTAYNTRLNLHTEVQAIVGSLKSLAETKKLELTSNLTPNLQQAVWADTGKIHQLFYNLIGNAIKFTDTGGIRVECTLTPQGQQLVFETTISDTGSGIPKDDLDKIFDKHYQSGHHQGQMSFGAGLGLSLCKEIVELYNGKISVESVLGKGTQIRFSLLLDIADATQIDAETQLRSLHGKTLAVIDDDPMSRSILKKLGNTIGFETRDFDSTTAFTDYFEKHPIDVVVVDLQLPEISGQDLIKQLRSTPLAWPQPNIMVITGDNYLSLEELKPIGADELLLKPVNKDEFYTKLLRLLMGNSPR